MRRQAFRLPRPSRSTRQGPWRHRLLRQVEINEQGRRRHVEHQGEGEQFVNGDRLPPAVLEVSHHIPLPSDALPSHRCGQLGGRESSLVTRGSNGPFRAGPQPVGLPESIARLRRALRRAARVADPANQLAIAQLELLAYLAEHPGARPGQLARLLHLRPNTITTLVNALTTAGMISRSTPDGDRRTIVLKATESGLQAVQAWQATNSAVLNIALATLTPQQRRALTHAAGALDALARAVDQLADAAARQATMDAT